MAVMSIQSHVTFGQVGNNAAILPLQLLGFDVWDVPTVLFSNHPGYGRFKGIATPAPLFHDMIDGVAELGRFDHCRALLSGYLGTVALGEKTVETAQAIKKANPAALYCLDPVMGDEGPDIYVATDIPAFMTDEALPHADIITPNQFELGLLVGGRPASLAETADAARALIGRGPQCVLVTSYQGPELPDDHIGMLAVTRDAAWFCSTPMVPLTWPASGAGDMTAALFLGHYLKGNTPDDCLRRTKDSVYTIIQHTHQLGRRELAIVQARHAITNFSGQITAHPI